jgi:hypothetical protein
MNEQTTIRKDSKYLSQVYTTKEELTELYIKQNKGTREIASLFGISQPTAIKLLKNCGIQLKTYKQNKMPMKKGDKMPESQRLAIIKGTTGVKKTLEINPETGRSYRYLRIKTNCFVCNKELYLNKYHFDKSKLHFCSLECFGKDRSIRFTGENNPTYYSIKTQCDFCKKDIEIKNHQLKRTKKHFCSRKCCGQYKSKYLIGFKVYNFKGNHNRNLRDFRGPGWNFARKQALIRNNYTCQICGKHKNELGKNPDVHHKIPYKIFGGSFYKEANKLENLMTLCNKCHKEYEEGNSLYEVGHFMHKLLPQDFSI